jgi:hypothetical protein
MQLPSGNVADLPPVQSRLDRDLVGLGELRPPDIGECDQVVDQANKIEEGSRQGIHPLGAAAVVAGTAFDSILIFAGHLRRRGVREGPIVLAQMKTGGLDHSDTISTHRHGPVGHRSSPKRQGRPDCVRAVQEGYGVLRATRARLNGQSPGSGSRCNGRPTSDSRHRNRRRAAH